MKTTLRLASLLLSLFLPGLSGAVTLQEIVDSVSTGSYSNFHANLYTHEGNSRGFSHNEGTRVPAYQHDLARDYIASNLNAMGYTTSLDPFSFSYTNDFGTYTYTNCNNVVAIKPGSIGEDIYIIGAHYDTVDIGQQDESSWVTNLCAGADDNASGVAAMLEIARVLKEYAFRDTIYFIAFDAEEKKLAGSEHFVHTHTTDLVSETNETTLLRSRIKGMISVDMVAFNLEETPDQVFVGSPVFGGSAGPISYSMEQAVTNFTGMQPVLMAIPGSDHNSFSDAGIDAALLMEGDFFDFSNPPSITFQHPAMHSDLDYLELPGLISYPYAAKCTQVIVGYLCEQARAIPPVTFAAPIADNGTVELSWLSAPDVAYSIYGTDALSSSNDWNFIQSIPATNTTVERSVQLSTSGSTQHMFKVISE
jgi:hypothetical protein